MSFLLDTQILLWSQGEPHRLPVWLAQQLEEPATVPLFSTISILEVVIKASLNKTGFDYKPDEVRKVLLSRGWQELQFNSDHALGVMRLAESHGDPFDRALLAQAKVEGLEFVTADRALADYGTHVRVI
jgi:PIN domain nuclease of toxin-antitoxin system